ncbi:connector of kinase to AP-1 isoform X1 [Osmia lignaria lignaria]|uniref:striatin isoform X1 n=1 Tax=Osmia bicornis bicornis TaxID=1437191 RepID=UPI0010F46163|nr:striatin isoform X1 [Osmia bicornis bicornis]XP_034183535.1 striatin-like isoform X1 [Osmia lignaria]
MKVPSQFCGSTMEDNSSSASQNHNGQLSSGSNVSLTNKHQGNDNGSNGDAKDKRPQYSMPGVLHFIQHEWARFELERSQWELDRAEFQARIAFLQGERKGQEKLKNDLVRRIKMLEYALKQERARYHKLKYGTDLVIPGDVKPPIYEEGSSTCANSDVGGGGDGEAPFTSVSNISWRQGRQILRQYLQEIGYTDTIIDVRSNRVRSLLGLNNNTDSEDLNTPALNGNEPSNKQTNENSVRRVPGKKVEQPSSIAEAIILDTEAAVMANFEFLAHTDMDMEEEEEDVEDDTYDTNMDPKPNKPSILLTEDVDAEAEEVLNELNLLTEIEESPPGSIHLEIDSSEWNAIHRGLQSDPKRPNKEGDSALELGELEQLCVNNEAETSYDMVATTKETLRKTWNAKYTLRSHFDAVRALVFHPTEPVLITASDDHTLKLWNLHKTLPAKKSASLDVEPLYTFRSHRGPVLCLAMYGSSHCYSGGLDGMIYCWALPSANVDPYETYEPSVLQNRLRGHTSAVWGLSMCESRSQLLSLSADGTVKLWSPESQSPLLHTYVSEQDGIPTSVDFIRDESHKLVVAYEGACVVFDTETGESVARLEANETKGVNRVVAHPTLPLVVAAHEDRHIRFYDHRSATLAHAMVAHLDAVTSLAVDPHGLYLLSGSHDCSIRLWNMDNKTCVQEITAHRKKFDESILDVAFHPSRPFIASAGADALAKVYV